MSTFVELQERLVAARYKRAILMHLINYMDAEFRPIAGFGVKKVILTDEQDKVPPEAFESVVGSAIDQVKVLDEEIASILGSALKTDEVVSTEKVEKKTEKGKGKGKSNGRVEGQREDGISAGNGKSDEREPTEEAVGEGTEETQGT